MTRHFPRFVTRTVQKGTVRIYGKVYRPSTHHLLYDGRLDRHRAVFALYLKARADPSEQEEIEDFVSLHHTEGDSELNLVEGYYRWSWWEQELEVSNHLERREETDD